MSATPRPSLRGHARLLRLSTDIVATLHHLHDAYGKIVDVGFRYPMRLTYVFGPEANRYVLADNPSNFTWREAYGLVEVVSGPSFLLVSDGAEHGRRRRQVQPAFSRRRIDAHLDLAVTEVDRTLQAWRPGRQLDAYAELRATVRRVSLRALFGQRLGEQADEIGEVLEPAVRHLGLPPASRRDIDLPGTSYRRANRARIATDAFIQAEIERRRTDGTIGGATDALGSILEAAAATPAGDEAPLTDEEIRDQVRGLIAAGYDTTSSAAAWLVYALGSNPAAFELVKEQVGDLLGEAAPTIDDLRQLTEVDAVVRETLRLWPPAAVGLRTAVDGFELFGHTVPAGSTVVYSPYITHRLDDVWDDARSFRPDRWADGEPEPFSYVPFGGGVRKCLGFALATLELQVLTVRLAQSTSWTVRAPDARPSGFANLSPAGGMPIEIAS